MTRRRNLIIWCSLSESHEQKSFLILIFYQLIFILLRLSNLSYLFGKDYNFEDILPFPWIIIINLTSCVKIQGAKNEVWKGSIIIAKIQYSSKTSAKTKVTLKIHDVKRARLNIFRKLVFHGTMYWDRGEKHV